MELDCRIVSKIKYRQSYGGKSNYFIGKERIVKTELSTDLGVVVDPQLKFSLHIRKKVIKAYAIRGIIMI